MWGFFMVQNQPATYETNASQPWIDPIGWCGEHRDKEMGKEIGK
jgi:hypothetical protein